MKYNKDIEPEEKKMETRLRDKFTQKNVQRECERDLLYVHLCVCEYISAFKNLISNKLHS